MNDTGAETPNSVLEALLLWEALLLQALLLQALLLQALLLQTLLLNLSHTTSASLPEAQLIAYLPPRVSLGTEQNNGIPAWDPMWDPFFKQ